MLTNISMFFLIHVLESSRNVSKGFLMSKSHSSAVGMVLRICGCPWSLKKGVILYFYYILLTFVLVAVCIM